MQLLINEVGLCDTVYPLAGSYFVETMTNEMESEMRSIMAQLDADGGIIDGVAAGRVQAAVNARARAYDRERKLQSGEIKKVGVNIHREEEEEREIEFHPYDEAQTATQIKRLNTVRATRDDAAVEQALTQLRQVAKSGANTMPALIDAVEVYATVGEVCCVLKDVFGTYQEPISL